MIIKLTLSKSLLDDYNYIDDKSNYGNKTQIIKELIVKEASRLREITGEKKDESRIYTKHSVCHPDRKHYAKGLCRSCYMNNRYN